MGSLANPSQIDVIDHGQCWMLMQVGKTTLIKCLVRHYTRQIVNDLKGPITVVAGKTRRLTFVECPTDLNGLIDAAKYADLVLLCVDGSFGFEMETFEFLNLLQVALEMNLHYQLGLPQSTSFNRV